MAAMESYFGEDSRRIEHARRVTGFAEELLKSEQGDPETVIAAAVFHDIGIKNAEAKYGSSIGKYQEIEGPPVAREILERLGIDPRRTDEVCRIIAHHHSPGKVNTTNFKILYDADWLVNLRDEHQIEDRDKLSAIIGRVFLTRAGQALARKTYLD